MEPITFWKIFTTLIIAIALYVALFDNDFKESTNNDSREDEYWNGKIK